VTYDPFPLLRRQSYDLDRNAGVLRSPVLDGLLWLTHGTTTRSFAPPDTGTLDLMALVRRRLVPGGPRLFCAKQVHGTRIRTIDPARHSGPGSPNPQLPVIQLPETDALIAAQPGVPIAIQTADCVPLLLADVRRKRLAVVHAGWRGSLDRIAERAVAELERQGSEPADLVAWIGPAVCGEAYEISAELADRFRAAFPNLDGLLSDRRLDLILLNAHQLSAAGVPGAQIHAANLCTVRHTDLCYSYRAEGEQAGRMVTYAMIL